MYNYWIVSAATTLILTSASISEWRITFTLKVPRDLISYVSWIIDGFMSNFSIPKIVFEISVGLTEPYNSLFSVFNFLIVYFLLLIFS